MDGGETVPVDALITSGGSAVREDTFNGEHLPRAVSEGDTIYAGTVNVEQAVEARYQLVRLIIFPPFNRRNKRTERLLRTIPSNLPGRRLSPSRTTPHNRTNEQDNATARNAAARFAESGELDGALGGCFGGDALKDASDGESDFAGAAGFFGADLEAQAGGPWGAVEGFAGAD